MMQARPVCPVGVQGQTMLTGDFLRGRRREQLTEAELQAVEDSIAEVREIDPRQLLLRAGEPLNYSTFLIEGFMCRYMDDRDGRRQLVALQVTGDFVDLHAFPLRYLDHDIATITRCRVGLVPHERLTAIVRDHPNLARMLWFSTLLDAAMHREWIFRLGRLSAVGRVAHFLSEIDFRLGLVGQSDGTDFALPLTQADLAEACGMTPVHLNRVLRRLRDDGVVGFRDGLVRVADRTRLWRLAEFDPRYLFPDGPADRDAPPA